MDTEQALYGRGGALKGSEIWFQCIQSDRHRNGDRHHSGRFHVDKRTAYCDVCKYSAGEKQLKQDLGMTQDSAGLPPAAAISMKEVAAYNYQDEQGNLLYQVVRFEPKNFRQRRPGATAGEWNYSLDGVRRVLYGLPELAKGQDTVLLVEGEKDVETARRLGFTATTSPGGAGKWKDEYGQQLKGRVVVVIPDADEVGQRHADEASANLAQYAKLVLRLQLPDTAKDLSDWVASYDGSEAEAHEELQAMVAGLLDEASKHLGLMSVSTAAQRTAEDVKYIREHGYDLKWGIRSLDERLGGILRRRLYVVGGRTSHGKTLFMMNVVLPNIEAGKRVLYFAMENPDEIAPRLAALAYNVPLENFVKPHMIGDEEYGALIQGLKKVETLGPLMIAKPPSMEKVKQAVAIYRPDIVVLDYVQRWVMSQGGADGGEDNKYRLNVGRGVSVFTDIAQENNCAAFVLSQMARRQRPMPQRGGKSMTVDEEEAAIEPNISELKESGDIENFADNIILINWPHKDNAAIPSNRYKIIAAKLKMGETGSIRVQIDPSSNRLIG